MMNSNMTSKIVIALGLAAAVGVAASILAVQARQLRENQFALNEPAPAMDNPASQDSIDATAAAQGVARQPLTGQVTTPSGVVPAVPEDVAPPAVGEVAKNTAGGFAGDGSKPARSKKSGRHIANNRNNVSTPVSDGALAAGSGVSQANESATGNLENMTGSKVAAPVPPVGDATPASTVGTTTDMQPAPAPTGPGASTGPNLAATGDTPVPSDSQITANVKSEIATAAPDSKVEVTTTNGIVALAGSVPSKDAIIQAEEAAQRVAGVKYVDASALTISDQ